MTTTTFTHLHLQDFIFKAIADLNFETPSQIQLEAIPKILNGEDIIAMAPTGSGKTAAFCIPALQKIDISEPNIQILVLCPTRELVIQAHKEVEKLTKYNEQIVTVSIYGGQQIEKQFNALKRNPQVLIATPGRLIDHLKRKTINLNEIKIAVLDEADEMLDMGFREDLHTILEQTNNTRQTILFSATMEKNIMEIAKKFQKSPSVIDVLDNLTNMPDIEQYYMESNEKDKAELITRMIDLHSINQAIVFCNTKSNVNKLAETLKMKSFRTDSIHGDMNQSQREKVMQGFQKGIVKILVATDVAGRGIDVKNLDAVFNYDLPREDEDYIHRIGRTARAGQSGKSFTFITKRQINSLKRIERANGFKIIKKACPTIKELDDVRFNKHFQDIKDIVTNSDLDDFRSKIKTMTNENFTELDIAAALYKILTKKENMKINRQFAAESTVEENSDSSALRQKRNKYAFSSAKSGDKSEKTSFGRFQSKQKRFSKSRSFSKASFAK